MAETLDKITAANFTQERQGLVWIESAERERFGPEEFGLWYNFWLLVEKATERVMATIDGPTSAQISYTVQMDSGIQRKFISECGAKRYALSSALQALTAELQDSSTRRKLRRVERIVGSR